MRAPVDRVRVTPHGAFNFERSGSRWCAGGGVCYHRGVDLGGRQGDPVVAPEGGDVVVSRVVKLKPDTDKPFSGFGPGVVLLRGDSGRWHLLGHVRRHAVILEPDVDARDAGAHIERAILSAPGVRVEEGEQLAEIAGLDQAADGRWWGHVHWEVRPGPLAGRSLTLDPADWLGHPVEDAPASSPSGSRTSTSPARTSGGSSWLFPTLLLIGYWLDSRERGRR